MKLHQVVHLVRDPRALYASMLKRPKMWRHLTDRMGLHCDRIADDLALEDIIPKER